jgi:hypothetical protein
VNLEPPSGSRISVTADDADLLIAIPPGSGGRLRYLVRLILLVWLGGWLITMSINIWMLSSVQVRPTSAVRLVSWFIEWTLAGAFAAYLAYRAFRPPVPETLRLMPSSVIYDSGIPPLVVHSGVGFPNRLWQSIFPKRTRGELDRHTLQSLRLRETSDGNRLTVDADVDASRLELARFASEVEREWLHELLAKHYSLPLPEGRKEVAS